MLALPAPPPGTQQSWEGPISSGTAPPGGTIAYRVWGGRSGLLGAWLTLSMPKSSIAAIRQLALPPGNAADRVSIVRVPEGTRLQFGRVAPAFGQPGGGSQIQLLERIPSHRFGPGYPLPNED